VRRSQCNNVAFTRILFRTQFLRTTTDVLLGNVEFQHRHAAQLNTHANGIAERWVGSCRRDLLLDHLVALHGRHLKRLLLEYVRDHHEDRTHLGLEKETPDGRIRSKASGPFTGATRRAAPSLQSSGIVRIDFRPVLYICVYMRAPRAPGSPS
jgi:hypothetical protein